MYSTNLWKPTVCVQQNMLENSFIKVYSSHLYASFGTFCVKIGQLFAAQWVWQWVFKHLEDTKSTTISFDSSDLSIVKHTSKTHWTSNNWPILTQKVPKEAQRCGLQTPIEVCSSYLYASFDTFCVKIGQLFEAQWVFEECLKIDKSLSSKENVVDFGILPIV